MNLSPSQPKKIIQQYWSWRSESFDHQGVQQPEWLEVFRAATVQVRPRTILDVGTGTGFLAVGLARAGYRVTGIDISPAMLARARRKAREAGVSVPFVLGDAEAPPFRTESFDMVITRNLLWTLCEPDTALRHWFHLLRPGGRIVLSDGVWSHGGLTGLLRRLEHATTRRLHPGQGPGVLPRFWSAYRLVRKHLPYFRGLRARDAVTLLEHCGFRNPVHYEHLFTTHPYQRRNPFFVLAAERE